MDKLEAELSRPVNECDVRTVVPVIVPRECVDLDWPGPIVSLGSLPFAVAWASVPSPNHFVYVTHEQAAFWEESGTDWRKQAYDNLAEVTVSKPWWGSKDDESGKPFVLVLLHDDAFGPSRLLVSHLFDEVFPKGYMVALPERTCAVVYRTKLTAEQRSVVDGMIEGCFRHGTEPMSDQRFDPADFWNLPEAKAA